MGLPAARLDATTARRLEALGPAGVILFSRNVEDLVSLRRLTLDVREVISEPLVLMDQEGGRVDRLKPLVGASPAARRVAERGVEEIRAEAETLAAALRDVGVNVNCAPVVDLDEACDNALGDRCLGSDPWEVARLAREIVLGHLAQDVLPCLKHFPGLGRTHGDTHSVRPRPSTTLSELRERELIPFRALAQVSPAMMVCHAAFPGVTGSDEPASSSRQLVTDVLRRELGFDGLVLTDDLEMGAVSDVPAGERALAAVRAGCDLLLFCHGLESAEEGQRALASALESGAIDAEHVGESSRRIAEARARLRSPLGKSADGVKRLAARRRERQA